MCGDYSRTWPDPESVDKLSTRLAQICLDYGLEADQVRGHGEDGGDRTECPGRHFDMVSLRDRVRAKLTRLHTLREAYRDLRPPEYQEQVTL